MNKCLSIDWLIDLTWLQCNVFYLELRQEEKGTTEDEMVGWHHQLDGHEFEQAPGVGDGQGSLLCCSPWGSQRVGHNWVAELNWTTLIRNKAKEKWGGWRDESSCGEKITGHQFWETRKPKLNTELFEQTLPGIPVYSGLSSKGQEIYKEIPPRFWSRKIWVTPVKITFCYFTFSVLWSA